MLKLFPNWYHVYIMSIEVRLDYYVDWKLGDIKTAFSRILWIQYWLGHPSLIESSRNCTKRRDYSSSRGTLQKVII